MEKVQVQVDKKGRITIEVQGMKGGKCVDLINMVMRQREPENRELNGEYYERERERIMDPEGPESDR